MTMSMVQGMVPSTDVIEARSKPEQGFTKALRDASSMRSRDSSLKNKSVDPSESSASADQTKGSDRAEVRRDARGPEHATGSERATEMRAKSHPSVVDDHDQQVADEAVVDELEVAAEQASELVPVTSEVPTTKVPTPELAATQLELSSSENESTEVPVEKKSELETLLGESDEISVESGTIEPLAVLASPIIRDTNEPSNAETQLDTMVVPLEINGSQSLQKNSISQGMSEASERDLEALSQFLGGLPQSPAAVDEPLGTLVSEAVQLHDGSNFEGTVPSTGEVTVEAISIVASTDKQQAETTNTEQLVPNGEAAQSLNAMTSATSATSATPVTPVTPNTAVTVEAEGVSIPVESEAQQMSAEIPSTNTPAVPKDQGASAQIPASDSAEGQQQSSTKALAATDMDLSQGDESPAQPQSSNSQRAINEVAPSTNQAEPVAVAREVAATTEIARDFTRNEIGEPVGRAMVRLVERIEALRNAPPPRTMVLELRELEGVRVRVSLEGNSVRMSVLDGSLDSETREQLDQELSQALSQRGFDLAGQDDDRREQSEQAQEQVISNGVQSRPTAMRSASGLRI